MTARTRPPARRSKKSTPVKAKTPARVRAVASPATTAAKARTPARARAAAPPTVPRCRTRSPKTLPTLFRVIEGRSISTGPLSALSLSLYRISPLELRMGTNRFNNFTEYGIGIGLRAPHYEHILSRKPVVDWFEIISENFMIDGGRSLQILDQILGQYKVVQHGVCMYFGLAEKANREHLRRLKEVVKRT